MLCNFVFLSCFPFEFADFLTKNISIRNHFRDTLIDRWSWVYNYFIPRVMSFISECYKMSVHSVSSNYNIGDHTRRLISLFREIPQESFPNPFSYHPSAPSHRGSRPQSFRSTRRRRSLTAQRCGHGYSREAAFVLSTVVVGGGCFFLVMSVHYLNISHLVLHTGIWLHKFECL